MSDARPAVFEFAVRFADSGADVDARFQEVSGIEPDLQGVSVPEGGANRFLHQLPSGVKHRRLSLKRGLVAVDSRLVRWCKDTLEGDLASAVSTADVEVSLLDTERQVLRQWSFTRAYPVRWDITPFDSTRNELAIDQIDLAYVACQRQI